MSDAETLHVGPSRRARPPRSRRTTVVVVVLVVAVLAAVALAGYAFARSRSWLGAPTPGPTAAGSPGASSRPSATPGTTLTLPKDFGGYQRDDRSRVDSPVAETDDLATASAYYERNGVRQVLLVGAEPVYDLEQFLLSIGLSDITPVGDGFCGSYTGVEMCAVLSDRVAVGAVALAGQDRAALVGISQQARAAF